MDKLKCEMQRALVKLSESKSDDVEKQNSAEDNS